MSLKQQDLENDPIQIHISPDGNDLADASPENPLASFSRSAELAKEIAVLKKRPVTILVHGGIYRLNSPLVFTEENSAAADTVITFEAASGETPVISGRKLLKNLEWTRSAAGNGIWQTALPKSEIYADQVFLNGVPMISARYPKFKSGTYMGGLASIEEINKRAKNWTHSPAGAFIHGQHNSNWGSAHSRVTGFNNSGELNFEGGWQVNQNPGHGKHVFIEGIFDELSEAGEYYIDRESATLYLFPPNNTDMANAEIEIVKISSLLRLCGKNNTEAVRFIKFKGIHFTGTARTFMDTREPLLRGDWCIARNAAVFIENASNISFEHCVFHELGGNAVFISKYADSVNIRANRFYDLDASAVCVAGDPSAVREASYWNKFIKEPKDLEPGPKNELYPRQCNIEDNLMYNLGKLEKQTAGVLLSMSEKITVSHNSIFQIPRAGICINDGTWGGHIISENDVFNTVRESGDHGPFNAWGRDRHWIGSGIDGASVKKYAMLDNHYTTLIEHNRFSHYWDTHSWGIDLDDGSSNYILRNNLCLGCSFKLREGINRIVENNICITSEAPGKHCCYEHNEDIIRHNIIVNIRTQQAHVMILANPEFSKEIDYNLYFNILNNEALIIQSACKHKNLKETMSLSEWQNAGFDRHSIFADPLFVNPEADDYRVCDESPALKLGFKNFSMDSFGTREPSLKAIAQENRKKYEQAHIEIIKILKNPSIAAEKNEKAVKKMDWHGATLKDLKGMTELSAAGLAEEKGVLLLKLASGSEAEKLGLRQGDVILKINETMIENLETIKTLSFSNTPQNIYVWRAQKGLTLP